LVYFWGAEEAFVELPPFVVGGEFGSTLGNSVNFDGDWPVCEQLPFGCFHQYWSVDAPV
jgi:hypothetical protein